MDQRLVLAIASPAIRSSASDVVQLALRALDDLRKLDETLYERFVASRSEDHDPGHASAGLHKVWNETFHALGELLAKCRELVGSQRVGRGDPTPIPTTDSLDFSDFGPAEESSFDLEAGDIGELVEGIGDAPQADSETKRWAEAIDKIGSIQYGLSSQYNEALERLDIALAAGQLPNVLGLLDDTASSASEGIHAVVSAVYEAFVPGFEGKGVVPEYLTTLSRALLVRRGIAQLATALAPHNSVLQGDAAAAHADALATVRSLVAAFVASDTWHAMRAADRWELAQFDQELREQSLGAARLTSEGLAKYLESLGTINQREVLVRHDTRVLDELREALTNARELMGLSPKTSHDLVLKACRTALELRGRNPVVDRMLEQIAHVSPETSSPSQNEALMRRLDDILANSG